MSIFTDFVSNIKRASDVIGLAILSPVKNVPFVKAKIESYGLSGDVKATTPNKFVNAGFEFVANNPYTTALAVTTPFSSSAKSVVSSAISKLSITKKIALGGTALIGGGTVLANPSLAAPVLKGASGLTPESFVRFGSSVGIATEKPTMENITSVAKDNPVLTSVLIGGAAILFAKPISNALNFGATQDNTRALDKGNELLSQIPNGTNTTAPNSNKFDVKEAEQNRKALIQVEEEKTKQTKLLVESQEKQLKSQEKQLKLQNETQLEALKYQAALVPATVPVAASPIKKKTVKKKKKAKKKTTKRKKYKKKPKKLNTRKKKKNKK
jgi:hypothetical protein